MISGTLADARAKRLNLLTARRPACIITFMIAMLFTALLIFVLPLATLTYVMVGYLLTHGHLQRFAAQKEFHEGLKAFKGEHKKTKPKNMLVAKWLSFGGGFYGLAALYTYGVIEVGEVLAFVIKMLDPANWTFDVTVGLIIGFIINSLKNLVMALLWFTYWPPNMAFFTLLVWVGLGYLGYLAGGRLARDHHDQDRGYVAFRRWWREHMHGEAPEARS